MRSSERQHSLTDTDTGGNSAQMEKQAVWIFAKNVTILDLAVLEHESEL